MPPWQGDVKAFSADMAKKNSLTVAARACIVCRMKLEKYLEIKKKSSSEFARELGVDISTVTRWIPGEGKKQTRRPDWNALERLAVITNGEVMPNDFLPDEVVRKISWGRAVR